MVYNQTFNDENLQRYLNDIKRYPLLTRSEEYALCRYIRLNKDEDSLERLINSNLRFVVYIAKSFINNGLSLKDLIAEGNVGLITAAEKYDETRGFKFISYATYWIRNSILRALSEQFRIVRLPVDKVQLLLKMNRYYFDYEALHDQKPTAEHMEKIFLKGKKEKTKKYIMRMFYESLYEELSLDAEVDEDSKQQKSLHNILTYDQSSLTDELDSTSDQEAIQAELGKLLTIQEIEVVLKYYYEDRTLDSISKEIGISRERVRQIKEKALGKLSESKNINEIHSAQ